jgi:hypothetical protein
MLKFLESSPRDPRWYLLPVRVAVVTVIVTLLSFAVSLLLGICSVLLAARLRGFPPDLRVAYRYIAAPAACVVGTIVLVSAIFLEVRHYRRAKTLSRIERQMSRAH